MSKPDEHMKRKFMKILKRQLQQEKQMRERGIWSAYKSADRLPK